MRWSVIGAVIRIEMHRVSSGHQVTYTVEDGYFWPVCLKCECGRVFYFMMEG